MRQVTAKTLEVPAMREITVFDGPRFAARNAGKADRLVHLVLGEPDVSFGFVAGICGARLRAPFSAPWTLPLIGKARPRLWDYQRVAADLATGLDQLDVSGADLVLPAPHVAPDVVAKWTSALALAGFRQLPPDVSFHVDLTETQAHLDPKARQKLSAARRQSSQLRAAEGDVDCATAYAVIAANRDARGLPLHMPLAELLAMRDLVPVDFLLLEHAAGPAAAAVCYRLARRLAYVVYWGHHPDSPVPHAMNLLAAEVAAYYCDRGFTILDTGTASIAGEPQQGLADFKQSVGAIASLRARFTQP